MRYHRLTVDSVARRPANGRTTPRNVRDLKHVLARELYYRVMTDVRARQAIFQVA